MDDLDIGRACRFARWDHFQTWTYASPDCTQAAQGYQANMERATGILMLPGYAFMSGEQWQSCASAAKKQVFGNSIPSDEEFAQKHEWMNHLAATARKETLRIQPPEAKSRRFGAHVTTLKFSARNSLCSIIGCMTR
jgi:hypothetical protein